MSHKLHPYHSLPSLPLPAPLSPLDPHSHSVSPQKGAGLPRTSTKHDIICYIRPGTYHHINAEQGDPVEGRGSHKLAKELETLPLPLLGVLQEHQATQSYVKNLGKIPTGSLISVRTHESLSVDSFGHVHMVCLTLLVPLNLPSMTLQDSRALVLTVGFCICSHYLLDEVLGSSYRILFRQDKLQVKGFVKGLLSQMSN